MDKIKDLEKFLSSYRIMKADIENLKMREKEENIDLSCDIESLKSKIKRIDNAMNILDIKEKEIIKERYLEGMGKQSWKLIAESLFLSRARCNIIKNNALSKLEKMLGRQKVDKK